MIMAEFKTNSYTRRTDDVVWMCAAHDLFTLHLELAYYKNRHGMIMPNRDFLGIPFAVILGVVDGDAAKAAYAGYPESDLGVRSSFPSFPETKARITWRSGRSPCRSTSGARASRMARTTRSTTPPSSTSASSPG
jgi:hypothetical protein